MATTVPELRMATRQDLAMALAALGALPRRDSGRVDLDFEAFNVAIEGSEAGRIVVAYCDLVAAVRRIIQGVLGHGFHPSPAELRMVCNAQLEERATAAARQLRIAREKDDVRWPEPTPEAKARVAKLMEMFRAGIPVTPGGGEGQS